MTITYNLYDEAPQGISIAQIQTSIHRHESTILGAKSLHHAFALSNKAYRLPVSSSSSKITAIVAIVISIVVTIVVSLVVGPIFYFVFVVLEGIHEESTAN